MPMGVYAIQIFESNRKIHAGNVWSKLYVGSELI